MLIKLNKNALYINFNKHNLFVAYLTYKFYKNREYIVISIIPIGAYLYIQNKTTLLITLLAKYTIIIFIIT